MGIIDIKDIERKAELLCRKMTRNATDEELREIETWTNENDSRRNYFAQLRDKDFLREEMRLRKAIDTEAAEQKMRERIERSNSEGFWRSNIRWISGVAAAVVIAISATMAYWKYTEVTPPTPNYDEMMAMERTEANADDAAVVAKAEEGKRIVTAKEMKKYNVDEEFAEALEEGRKITTYVDKEYWTTLDDGTIVHLGSNSRLVYPEKFGGGQRDVILDGEAYFLVAQDKSRPFIVHTENGDIKEYGTKFHVNTNTGEAGATEVVLVSGSISVTGSDRTERMMTPGTRALMGKATTSIEPTDTVKYVAWHTGRYSFQETTLERVMDVVAHWYGYDVEYDKESMRNANLSGNFDRGEELDTILEALEEVTGLSMERTKDGKIIIK